MELLPLADARARYAAGKIDLIVNAAAGSCEYIYDPSRLGAEAAKIKANDVIQSGAGRKDALSASEQLISEPGSRYIDWLIPGLMGMNIMGGGMWGLGFVTVDMRMRKLLKRFVATPMKRSDFLLALMGSRILFLLTEMAVILGVGCFFFELSVKGSLLAVGAVMVLGAICFGGLGLLVACRTDKIETVSGILNVVMLPMYLLSGIFFSSERFPDSMQPLVQALPLTQLNNALRAIILEGMSLESQWLPALALASFGIVSFALALRWFRWQ
jgi:ABC-type multidrug transport system permease subunit